MRPDGTGLRRLTPCSSRPSAPSWYEAEWFADGRRLLAVRQGVPWMLAADGTQRRPVKLDQSEVMEASVSPDGRHFTYSAPTRTPEDMDALPEIWRARLDGAGARYIGDGWLPRWSPDGRRIAFAGRRGVSVMDASTGRHVRVLVSDFSAASLDWSPDSRHLAFAGGLNGGIWTVAVSGSRRTHRVFPRRSRSRDFPQVDSVAWSPDGSRLAFVRSEVGAEQVSYTIMTVTRRGTDVKRLRSSGSFDTEEGGGWASLSWGPKR